MKKVVAMLLTGAMVFSLAACGNSDAPAQTTETTETTEATTDTPAAEEEAAPAEEEKAEEPAGPVTLNVTTTYAGNDEHAEQYQAAIAAWQEETGNTVNDASTTSDESFKARVLADFEVGSEPDVLFYFNGVDSNPFVEAGKVVSIDEIRAVYPDYATNMKDGMMGASPVDGKNYSVPVNGYWEGMFVNKKVCEAAGVEVPDANTTWEQFLETCQKIKDAGYTPIGAALGDIPHYWFEYCIYNYQDPANHNILPESLTDSHGEAWVKGLGDIKTLYEKGFFPENTLSAKDDETWQMVIDGKAAFAIDGSWKCGFVTDNAAAPEDFTVTYIPGMNNRKTTDIIGGLSSGYYITKKAWDDPAKQKAAVDFVTYMTSDKLVSEFAQTSATALKAGATVDESTLTQLQKDSLVFLAGATGMSGAVQDQVPTEARVPVFDGMPNVVSGKVEISDAVQQVLDLLAAPAPEAEAAEE